MAAGRDLDLLDQLAVEANQAYVAALVSDVDSRHGADFVALLHALALSFQLLGELYLLFAGLRLGFGLLRTVLFALLGVTLL